MAPATHHAATLTRAVPARVWSELQDPSTWAEITGVQNVRGARFTESGDLQGYEFDAVVAGKTYPGSATTTESRSLERMVVSVASRDVAGAVSVVLTPNGDGTRMEVSVTLEPRGFLATLAFGAISGAVARGLPATVERMSARCESS